MVDFYIDNWLMASSAVGFARVLEHAGLDPEEYFRGRLLQVPPELWQRVPELYADFLLHDFGNIVKNSYQNLQGKEAEKLKNPYNLVVLSKLASFYTNSPFTNPSASYIREVERANNTIAQTYGNKPEERLKNLLNQWNTYQSQILPHVRQAVIKAFEKINSQEPPPNAPICFFCRKRPAYRTFDAVNFTPLSASPEALCNFFYKGKNTMHLCKECETLLYMARFGFTEVQRGKRYLFVYMPQKVQDMLRINRNLQARRWISKDLLMESLVEVAKGVESSKADWSLKNIYVVEIQVVGNAKSNIHSFSLTPKMAEAIKGKIEHYPKSLNSLFDLFLQHIYHGKSLYRMLQYIVSGYLYAGSYKNIDTNTQEGRLVTYGKKGLYPSLLYLINFQEVLNMQKDTTKEVNWAFFEGKKLANAYRESLGNERALKKVETLSYRLLEAVRRKDANHFSQNLIRAYLEVEKPIPPVFLTALKEGGLERIAYAFLIGLNGKEGELEPEGEAAESVGQE